MLTIREMRFNYSPKNKSTLFLLIVIVAAIIFVPMILSMTGMRAGFVDIGETINVPSAARRMDYYNSHFLPCRSDSNGSPCPEGTFCDGASRGCVSVGRSNL